MIDILAIICLTCVTILVVIVTIAIVIGALYVIAEPIGNFIACLKGGKHD